MSAIYVPKKPGRFAEAPKQKLSQYFQWQLNCWRSYDEQQLTPLVLQRHVADMLRCMNEELAICKNSTDDSFYHDLNLMRFNSEKLLAYCLARAGEYDEAFKIFEKVLNEKPYIFHTYEDCINVLCVQKKWHAAACLINSCPVHVLISEEEKGFQYLNTIFKTYPDIAQLIDGKIHEIVKKGVENIIKS